MATQGLFVYGTLHPDHAPAEIRSVVRRMKPLGGGTVRGKVYDLGDYPALTVHENPKQRVAGAVFALPDDPQTLPALDQYEDFRPDDPTNSLFIRTKRTVTLADGKRKRCWVYIYNQALPQAG